MEYIKAQLGKFGALLAVFGLASSVLSFFDYNLRLLIWIDIWGTGIGWALRIAFILVGAILFFLFGTNNSDD